jgi:hypothetical protein
MACEPGAILSYYFAIRYVLAAGLENSFTGRTFFGTMSDVFRAGKEENACNLTPLPD